MAIASDHTGVALRQALVAFLRGRGLAVQRPGHATAPIRWTIRTWPPSVARAVARGEADAGIVIDGAGIGSAIAANKVPGIRAVMATTETIARYSREHNGANVLTLGATLVTPGRGRGDRRRRGSTTPMREPRYIRRLAKIRDLERASSDRVTTMTGDSQRLIDVIVQEMAAAPARAAAARCRCHAVVDDCCPDRLRGVIDAGATRVGVHAAGGAPDGRRGDDRSHAAQARRDAAGDRGAVPRGGAVQVRHGLREPDLGGALRRSCSRAPASASARSSGFPLGATTADVKGYETRRAIFDGAREIDMVINVGALKSGDLRTVERDIEAVTSPCRDCGVLSKVIIEAALLTDDEKVTACTLAKAAGADYVKTSTGFGPGGATAADVALMRRVVGRGDGREGGRRRARSRGR